MEKSNVINHISQVLTRLNIQPTISATGVCGKYARLKVVYKAETKRFRNDYKVVTGKEAPKCLDNVYFNIEVSKDHSFGVIYKSAQYIGRPDYILYYESWIDEEAGKKVKREKLQREIQDLKYEFLDRRFRGKAREDAKKRIANLENELAAM